MIHGPQGEHETGQGEHETGHPLAGEELLVVAGLGPPPLTCLHLSRNVNIKCPEGVERST